MTYKETIDYLYNIAPAFTKVGAAAYKEGLSNTEALDAHAGHPHKSYLTIHVAGTNGKGSCSHSIAAILQEAGMKVGLFTSPHLVNFRERIRINGEMIPEEYIVRWVNSNKEFFEPLMPSFFEVTTAMAFEYFRDAGVDIAVIEVGLGGRLDCTNIISPILSVITNISADHTQFLGTTLAEIAAEKAGIIKNNTPVVIGETTEETRPVFLAHAKKSNAPIIFAEETTMVLNIDYQLKGAYQTKNLNTVLASMLPLARELKKRGIKIDNATQTIKHALANVCTLTGIQGRWQQLSAKPLTICDTGHNAAGWQYLSEQIERTAEMKRSACPDNSFCLRMIFGMVDDKDIDTVMKILPRNATFYFTQASTHRAIPALHLKDLAMHHGIKGEAFNSVADAYETAKRQSSEYDMIFIGGSNYVIADLLTHLGI